MQVLIERARRIAHRGGYIQLILHGGSVFLIRIYGWVDGNPSEKRVRGRESESSHLFPRSVGWLRHHPIETGVEIRCVGINVMNSAVGHRVGAKHGPTR